MQLYNTYAYSNSISLVQTASLIICNSHEMQRACTLNTSLACKTIRYSFYTDKTDHSSRLNTAIPFIVFISDRITWKQRLLEAVSITVC